MRFVNISPTRWIIANPALEMIEKTCEKCGVHLIANKPFIDDEWLGLISDRCNCEGPKSQIASQCSSDPSVVAKWSSLILEITENL